MRTDPTVIEYFIQMSLKFEIYELLMLNRQKKSRMFSIVKMFLKCVKNIYQFIIMFIN